MTILFSLLILFGPVVIVLAGAAGAERLRRRARAADLHTAATKGAVRGGWADEPENDMHRASSPLRLAALRALVVGGVLALPVVVLAATTDLTRGHVAWLVVACHAALGVAGASFVERHAAGRRRPIAGALHAGLISLAAVTIGGYQCEAAAATLLGGGPEEGLAVHAATLAKATRDPIGFALGGVLFMTMISLTWALPFAGMTYERLCPGNAPVYVLVALFTLAAGLPAAVALAFCYPVASALDRWLGRPPAGLAE